MHRNSEGYADPTVGQALSNITKQQKESVFKKEEERKNQLIKVLKMLIEMSNFELVGRIQIKSKSTQREYL